MLSPLGLGKRRSSDYAQEVQSSRPRRAVPDLELDDFAKLADARRLWHGSQREAAVLAYEAACRERPRNLRALLEAARALGQRFHIVRAEELLARAAELGGEDLRVGPQLAQSYAQIYRPHQAIRCYERLQARGPLPPPALAHLATICEQVNRVEQANAAIEQCLTAAGDRPEPRLIQARLWRRAGRLDEAAATLAALVERGDVPPPALADVWAEWAQVKDRLGDYDGAVDAIEQTKRIVREMPEARELVQKSLINNQVFAEMHARIDQRTLARWRSEAAPDSRVQAVAHLLGFPRSGTTLLEQVVAAHPGLIDAPEMPVFTQETFPAMCRASDRRALAVDSLDTIPPAALAAARTRYLDCQEEIAGELLDGRVLLDKNPSHSSLVGPLLRLYPAAPILFAVRDPRDVLVSAGLRHFPLNEFSSLFLTWGSACAMYAHDMQTWRRMRDLLGDQAVEIRYEDTVADLETQARRALTTLTLPWDAQVLNYREAGREKLVHSPSHDAVRQPVYQSSVGRWKRYEKKLGPYFERLQPWVEWFGYS